jgi:phosphate-selective porin
VTNQNAFDTSEFDGFSIRRARLSVYGEVIDKWKYQIQISADGAENADNIDPTRPDYRLLKDEVGVKLQDAYITYDRMPYFNVTGGQFKSRFSPSYIGGGPLLPLCERPLVVDKLAPKRDIGVSIESAKKGEFDSRGDGAKLYDKPVFYAVGLYNGNGMNKLRNDNNDFMVTAMLLVRPAPYINFGVSYAYDKNGYDYEDRVFGLPELTEDGDYYVYRAIDLPGAEEFNIWDVNSAFDAGRVHIQAEYINRDGPDVSRAYGYGIQGQVDVTDFFQFTARYDELDRNVDIDTTLDSRWYTLGYNWFFHGQNVKWQLNYSFREEMHGEQVDNNALITHFQLLF